MDKVVLLTGGSKGIGFATARKFAEKGCRVYEISRHEAANPGVSHLTGDVTDKSSVEAAVQTVVGREGRIDILVCNAGTVLSGAIEFTELENIRMLMDLNFYGMVNAVCAVLPYMRKAGAGRIVCLSSMAAPFPIPFQAYYSASKAAVVAFASALGNEVKKFGVSVCYVMPGDTKTEPVRHKFHAGDDVYGGMIGRSVAVMERDEANGMPPEKVGDVISNIALKSRVRPAYSIGLMSKLELFLKRVVTESFAHKIVGMMYVK
ncbi:Short-chain dehydrogenase [Sporobacter termitidis DSM 10068]|uniref:Short-chain dehydrogenase n=1 Tax=Sporobacter termitidis DSM 10068 TaxID=1123282 RepID=A0A1M5YAE8_9FIRM|nr:SDR family NAD(P)-dependent oxidoreductase [Sporobacter termitidis]SHI08483.1 Short-chain dehydrogenase [Sporobacter termitidis DSM 10068]